MDWLSFYLLNVDRSLVTRLRQVTALDTFEGATKNFHPDGLYSTTIFGPVGSDQRDDTFSYLDVGVEIISPAIALTLFELKRLYRDVMAGSRFAVWDEKEKDFLPAAPGDQGAGTGYGFFISKWQELSPKVTESTIRQESIETLNKFRSVALSRYVLVLPAGNRDLEVTSDGKDQENEITPLYRKLLTVARTVPNLGNKNNPMVDNARWRLQETFNELYKLFYGLLEGKKGVWRGKVTSRRVFNTTRNVISSMDASSPVMGREDAMRVTDTLMGLYQGLKSILPVAIYRIRTTYLPPIDAGNGSLYLINPKTLQREMVSVSAEDYDLYTTDEGVEKLITKFRKTEDKHKPLKIDDKYVLLIYNNGKEFKVLYDIGELPDDRSRKDVTAITYTELLYLSGYAVWNEYFTIVTRYPVAGQGSTYSSTIRLTTTARTKMCWELDDSWQRRAGKPAIDYPRRDVDEFVTSMAPHPSRLSAMAADFDGDTGSGDSLYTDESLRENRIKIGRRDSWLNTNNKLTIDIEVDTIVRTVHNLLDDPVEKTS